MVATGLYQVKSIRNFKNRILNLAFVSEVCDVVMLDSPSFLLSMDAHHKPFVLQVQIWKTRNNASSDSTDEQDFDCSLCDIASLNASLSTINWTNELVNKRTDDAVPHKCLRPKKRGYVSWWSPELRRL